MSGMKLDCRCPRARHEHGTRGAYDVDRCRCFPCRIAWSHAKAQYRRTGTYIISDPLFVSRVGTDRRVRALLALGWRHSDITARLRALDVPCATETTQLLRRPGPFVWAATASAVACVYDDLAMTVGPSQRTRDRAVKLGYLPPLAWDDDLIDDPAAERIETTGSGWDLKPCGTPAAARRHYRRGEPLCGACRNAERRRRAA